MICLALSLSLPLQSQTVVFYNVENLFHPDNDSLHADDDFTPEGKYRWSKRRYYHKLHQIARVLTCIEDDYPALVGLAEVEQERCVRDLCRQMPKARYKYIHFDSPDRRGIDVALLYDSVAFEPTVARPLPVYLDSSTTTRDILYVSGNFNLQSSISNLQSSIFNFQIFICHLPSQRGGSAESSWKRERAKMVLRHHCDSILSADSTAHILVIGDMNSDPQNDLQSLTLLPLNIKSSIGTHRYQGRWSQLDQAFVSPSMAAATFSVFAPDWLLEPDNKYLGYKPRRTFVGFRYNPDGFSDHLPIVVNLK